MYIHIPKEKRKKGIFVGYSESSKAYRIYFPGFKKIDIRRDVTFYEDTAITERNPHGLGHHNRQLHSRNQSFPICNRNKKI